MQVTAIIAEWNPLHRGHLLPVQAARQQGATHIVAILSGNFVQRGEPALCPWQYRAAAALSSGVDLVLQLPLPYAVSTAQHFAEGAVASLAALGAVDSLIFGSECGELAALRSSPPPWIPPTFRLPWPPICKRACPLQQPGRPPFIPFSGKMPACSPPPIIFSVSSISGPSAGWAPISNPLPSPGRAPPTMPPSRIPIFPRPPSCGSVSLPARISPPPYPRPWPNSWSWPGSGGPSPQLELWERAFLARLRAMTETDYAALPDVTEGLEHRLYRASRTAKTTEELLAEAKTKRYTHARLRRVLLAAMLELPAGLSTVEPPYLRVLGFTAKGAEILNRAKGRHTLPLSASLAELEKTGEAAARFAALETRAADLYHAFTPGLAPCGSEYTTPVIKI